MLNAESPLPLYRQLADVLTAQIREGRYRVGQRIPSEHELCREFGIGRPTVRQATDLLVRKRMLQRRRGAGTFVCEGGASVDLFTLAGTLQSFRQSGLEIETEVLTPLAEVIVEADRAEHDMNPFRGEAALYFARLSRMGRHPVLLERFHLHRALFRGLEQADLTSQSLSAVVQERLHLRPRAADQCFDVAEVRGKRARILGLSPCSNVLRVRRKIHFAAADSAIYVELFCRTDRLAFCQTILGADHA